MRRVIARCRGSPAMDCIARLGRKSTENGSQTDYLPGGFFGGTRGNSRPYITLDGGTGFRGAGAVATDLAGACAADAAGVVGLATAGAGARGSGLGRFDATARRGTGVAMGAARAAGASLVLLVFLTGRFTFLRRSPILPSNSDGPPLGDLCNVRRRPSMLDTALAVRAPSDTCRLLNLKSCSSRYL